MRLCGRVLQIGYKLQLMLCGRVLQIGYKHCFVTGCYKSATKAKLNPKIVSRKTPFVAVCSRFVTLCYMDFSRCGVCYCFKEKEVNT
jgi:hypothetical protein